MDPQQRVALRVSWRALENSGINPDDMAGHDMGCYLGASATGYGPQMAEFSEYSGHLLAGTALSVISGRIAYTLGSMGPAVTIDSSCASALVAFHAAVRGLQNGDCDVALAGGGQRAGLTGILRRVLQAARPIRRRPLPRLQRAGQRDRLGGGGGRLCAATKVGGTSRRAIHPCRSSRQRHQPRRPQRRPERAERRGPGQFVPPRHRRGGRASRRGRDGRRAWHRHQARGPYRVAVVGADIRRHRTGTRRPVGIGEIELRPRPGCLWRIGSGQDSGGRQSTARYRPLCMPPRRAPRSTGKSKVCALRGP